jgi:RNA recognition motif-containing protein
MNIFVAKINYRTQEDSLRSLFEQYGEVDSVKIVMDRDTGRSKGFGFVEMPNDEEAQSAISALNETDFENATIVVNEARPRENNNRGGGGGFRGGNRGGYGGNSGGGYGGGGYGGGNRY